MKIRITSATSLQAIQSKNTKTKFFMYQFLLVLYQIFVLENCAFYLGL
jgi:hypothetical protein